MIITRLIGGLGNQLFQYAVARALSVRCNDTVKLDITGFETYKLHAYSLARLNIKERFATKKEIGRFCGDSWSDRCARILGRYLVVEETKIIGDIPALPERTNLYLKGYWQSERYFKSIEDIIRKEFTIKAPLSGKNKEYAEHISATESVSLHIRRCDYVTNPQTNQMHGTCDLDYYREALEVIRSRVREPHLFVFSDDHAWTRENINFGFPTVFVTHNDAATNYEDLRLMSLCKHNIIANSTFSWWGAWLNRNPGKIVIAPQRWFADEEKNRQTGDLIPKGWIRL